MPRERSPPVCSQSVYVPLPQFVTTGNLPVPHSQGTLGVDARPPDEHYLVRATACLGGRAIERPSALKTASRKPSLNVGCG
jgi:hypothetical protein